MHLKWLREQSHFHQHRGNIHQLLLKDLLLLHLLLLRFFFLLFPPGILGANCWLVNGSGHVGPTLTLERNLNQSSRFLSAARRLEHFIISLRLNQAEWRTFQKMKYRPKSPEKIPLRRVDVSFQAMNIRIGWNMKSAHRNNQWYRNWATTWNSISRVLMDGIWLGSFSPPPPPTTATQFHPGNPICCDPAESV